MEGEESLSKGVAKKEIVTRTNTCTLTKKYGRRTTERQIKGKKDRDTHTHIHTLDRSERHANEKRGRKRQNKKIKSKR